MVLVENFFMASYSEKDFNACMFNPLVKKKMGDAFPRLYEIVAPEWVDENLDAILRYVCLVYDPKSLLVTAERDLNYRKSVAAELARINMSEIAVNEAGESLVASVFNCTHPYLADLIIRYLTRFVKTKEWIAIVVVESCFWESTKKLLEPISGKNSKEELEAVQKKAAIKDELDKDISRLEKYYKAFFGEDEQLEMVAKSKMSPESIARQPKKIENVLSD